MQSPLLEGFKSLNLSLNDPEERLLLSGVSWQDYEKLLVHLGDSSRYRVSYLDGILEIMSPSRRHEVSKKDISRLLEVYLEEYNRLQVYHLSDRGEYQQQATSQLLPDLSLSLLAKYVNAANPRLAVREFRALLRQAVNDK